MNFTEAWKHLQNGKKIRLSTWVIKSECFGVNKEDADRIVAFLNGKVRSHRDLIEIQYINSNDWEIYKESMGFMEAMKLVNEGKWVKRRSWTKDSFIFKDENQGLIQKCCICYNTAATFSNEDINATDWQEVG